MPELEKIETSAAYVPQGDEVVTFFAEENGKVILKAKKPDGTVENILEGN